MVVVSLLPLVDIDPWDQLPAFVRPKYWRLCVSCAQPEAHHSVSRHPLTRPTYKPWLKGGRTVLTSFSGYSRYSHAPRHSTAPTGNNPHPRSGIIQAIPISQSDQLGLGHHAVTMH